ncbi:MAG: rhomboid family intramembrane serine protease [Myxococcales bacterium]|nr:rhomboid family intramembrane serine protease [Myxococcales bacterium]
MRQLPTPASHDRSLGGELRRIFVMLGAFLGVLWGLEIVDANIMHGSLDDLGIMPRTASGLLGILAAPFLHGGFGHLISNTIGIVILGGLTMAIGRREFIVVSLVGMLVGGLGTWAFGRPAIHIGASGLIFAYLGYLVLRGWYDRRLGSVLLAGAVAWFYGSMIFGMIPGFAPPVISWEGHLFGFIGGVLAARLLHKRDR